MTTDTRPSIASDLRRAAAKAFAASRGDHGATGGWIYDCHGRALVQGWFNYEHAYYRLIRDWVTAQVTAFDTFEAFTSTDERYCPTLLPRTWREQYLADCFDLWCYQAGQSRRAWRGIGR